MKKKILLSILFWFTVIPSTIFSQEWSDSRNHETLVFTGNSISRFETDSIKYLFLYSFREADNSWREITMQIDEIAPNVGYFGKATDYNKTLDLDDEFVFMVQDAGDYAPPTSWIDDADSRNYYRHQFEIINPDNPLVKKYVYVYRSSTLSHDPSLPIYYIKYVPPTSGASDTVKAMSYLEGHNAKGIPDVWKVADTSGIYGPDFLDRQKARANGKYKWSFLTIDYKMTEDNLIVSKFEYKRGPIRIIRNIAYKAELSGLEANIGTFQYRYYPFQIVSLGADKKLESEYGVKLIRQSFDLDSTAIGMKFHNADNTNIPIDGAGDVINDTLYQSPVMNWYMSSGNPGTVVMLNEFTPPASSIYNLYYQESLTGATADGTKETGDSRSYGDAGILFRAPEGGKITGAISLPYTTYFLPGQQAPETGATLAHQTQTPVYKNVALDTYLAPAEIAISIADTSSPAMYPVSIPVKIGNTTGLNIKSCRLVIHFDSKVLTAKNVTIANTLAENWDVPGYSIATDTITIEMNGTTALKDSGALVYLNFDVIGTANQQSPLRLIQAKLNVWNPLAVTDDGVFTTLPIPQVMVSLPDTSGDLNSKISIPILIDDVTSLNITSCQLELSYSRVILDATSATLQGTLASDWSIVNIVDNPGYLTLAIAGTAPLGGTGALVWINFDVIGSPGQSTSILFKKMQFNDGEPIANFRNGRFTINATTVERITVIIPDTTAQSGALFNAPVLISESINAEIQNYKMTLEFDRTILTFKNIDMMGTLTSPWRLPNVVYSPGKIQISAEGDLPLSGVGTLIFIVFDVIGPDGSNTTIHFSEMIVNSGTVSTITDDGIINVQGVVPVELASFTAISDGRNVTVRWHTITETNNFGFYLQRKSNLSPDWQTIKFLPGAGTTSIPQSYSIIDWQLDSGTWHYRLKQQDLDGQVHYSQIIEVNLLPTQFSLFQNYPNPFNSSTIIRYDLAAGEHDVKIIIFDLLGQQIKILFNEQQQGGSYQMSWDGSDDGGRSVATGIYFCHLLVGQTAYVKKMVLIE